MNENFSSIFSFSGKFLNDEPGQRIEQMMKYLLLPWKPPYKLQLVVIIVEKCPRLYDLGKNNVTFKLIYALMSYKFFILFVEKFARLQRER